jgi:hypothetical protein
VSFDKFQADFMRENRKLKIIIGISLIIFSIGTISNLLDRKYFLYQGRSLFEERPLAEEVCRLGFLSVVDGNPNPFVVSKGIIDLVKKDPFSMTISKILKLASSELGSCHLILKADGRLMAFKIKLQGHESNPFFYKLQEIEELALKEEG